ncbi:MAG: TetR/AcrR family transcriptional regulator [Pseudomonadota bacterium]
MPAPAPMRERLLDAAATVFLQQGYHQARIADIVRRAGAAQGTFYLYFKGKDAAFLELIDSFFGRLLNLTLERYPAKALKGPQDVAPQLRIIWRTILAFCRAEPALTALVLREAHSLGPAHRTHMERHFQRVIDALAAYFEEAASRGIFRPAPAGLAAWVVLGMIERAIHYAVSIAPDADLDQLARDLTRIELGGFLGGRGILDDEQDMKE